MFVIFYSKNQLPPGVGQLTKDFLENPTNELAKVRNDAIIDFRRDFELPCWPYNVPDADGFNYMDHFCEFLRDLGIFYYDDQEIMDGKTRIAGPLHPYPKEFYKEFDKRIQDSEEPVIAYRYKVYLYKNTGTPEQMFTPLTWEYGDNSPSGKALKEKIQSDPITKDDLAWAEFGKDVSILQCRHNDAIRVDLAYKSTNTVNVSEAPDNSKYHQHNETVGQVQEKVKEDWVNTKDKPMKDI